ncbi:MAG: Asp-tRNA(Asn)/Glu-tRNA(Gln) amidotransferase subunit GatC [bacterium]|nr:Asp-tRNA(Asn)/Glu-tRNA(Gln) amidotransferase subunit GatC [bacterium]
MALTKDQVRHVAKLARLNLSEEEVEKFTPQLASIFQHLDKLAEVDTKDVPETAQVSGLETVTRADTVKKGLDREDFLKTSQRESSRGMIKVRKSI